MKKGGNLMSKIKNHMKNLIEKHQRLDKEVNQMQINHAPDFKIRELKKQKLNLKEEIARMEKLEKYYPTSF
jgi:uncharacterized protein YdcH (DUF465 family)